MSDLKSVPFSSQGEGNFSVHVGEKSGTINSDDKSAMTFNMVANRKHPGRTIPPVETTYSSTTNKIYGKAPERTPASRIAAVGLNMERPMTPILEGLVKQEFKAAAERDKQANGAAGPKA